MCLRHMVDKKWDVTVFGYEPISNLPAEIPFVNAQEVLDICLTDAAQTGGKPLSGAMVADIFRLHMMKSAGYAWIDSDFLPLNENFPDVKASLFAFNEGLPNNATMYFHADDPLLGEYLEKVSDFFPNPQPFYANFEDQIRQRQNTDDPFHCSEMHARRFSGPFVLQYLLEKYNRTHEALSHLVFYAVSYTKKWLFWQPEDAVLQQLQPQSCALHMWGSRVRRKLIKDPPSTDSFLGKALAGVDLVPA